jgi:hypothetical protein
MVRLVGKQIERGFVLNVSPIDSARAQVLAYRLNGGQELALLDRESANTEINGRTLLQNQQGFEQRQRVFASGQTNGNPIAMANHAEFADGLADFVENGFF